MQNIDIQIINDIDHDDFWGRIWSQQLSHTSETPDQIWIMNMLPCYSAGNDLRQTPLPDTINGLPVRRTRRGGAMTYCGPGQVQLGLIMNLRRRNLTPAEFTGQALQSLAGSIKRRLNREVLVNLEDVGLFDTQEAKLGSCGFSYKNGILGGGVALNFCMDLSGFDHIEVCGVRRRMSNLVDQKLTWTALANHGQQLAQDLADNLTKEQQWPVPVE